jgi:hypothetical protein
MEKTFSSFRSFDDVGKNPKYISRDSVLFSVQHDAKKDPINLGPILMRVASHCYPTPATGLE